MRSSRTNILLCFSVVVLLVTLVSASAITDTLEIGSRAETLRVRQVQSVEVLNRLQGATANYHLATLRYSSGHTADKRERIAQHQQDFYD